jgi:transcriptional regulator with XRE-family HTH domain
MFKIGQVVQTRRGNGVISSVGDSTPYVYVRLDSGPDEIYVMDRSDLLDLEGDGADYSGSSVSNDVCSLGEMTGRQVAQDPGNSGGPVVRRLSRRSTKRRNASEPTPIARFVNDRLEELGLKQCEFCRKTGFDQGLLSRIQSSTSSNLSLESCLRLAIGCSVSPQTIFDLVGRTDFHSLIVKSYSNSTQDAGPAPDQAAVQKRTAGA